MYARGHQIIARAFWCALGQHRRFNIDETGIVEEATESPCGLVTQHHVLLHLRAPKVENSVLQTNVLVQILFIKLERRRHRWVKHFDRMAEDFYLATRHVRIDGAGRSSAHLARNFQAELIAHGFCEGEHFRAIRVADDLSDAFSVTQVDENNAPMIATTMRPAAQADFLADVL